MSTVTEQHGLREENRTLYGVIKLVSSSVELGPMLQGIVDLATQATDCHACFIYLLEDDQLTIRAASQVFADAVGRVQLAIEEGLTGWVARNRTPEFIRERAMNDPRMKYIPLLQEERFQSMVAVPILSRSSDTLGVIVLHTEAPREFTEDTLKLLVHIASLVSGAIENAQLYQRERRRADTLTRLAGIGGEVAAATDADDLGLIVARGTRRLLEAELCQVYRLNPDDSGLALLTSDPAGASSPAELSTAGFLIDALDGRGSGSVARGLWPGLDIGDLLLTPLTAGGERLGLLCAGSPPGRKFSAEDTEFARAIAHIAAVAIKRAELIESLTNANIVKDLFEALAAGATSFAVAKAAEVRCDSPAVATRGEDLLREFLGEDAPRPGERREPDVPRFDPRNLTFRRAGRLGVRRQLPRRAVAHGRLRVRRRGRDRGGGGRPGAGGLCRTGPVGARRVRRPHGHLPRRGPHRGCRGRGRAAPARRHADRANLAAEEPDPCRCREATTGPRASSRRR